MKNPEGSLKIGKYIADDLLIYFFSGLFQVLYFLPQKLTSLFILINH